MVKHFWLLVVVISGSSAIWLWFLYTNDVLKEEKYKKYRKIFVANLIIVEFCFIFAFFLSELEDSFIAAILCILAIILGTPYSILIESEKALRTFLEALSGSRIHLRKVLLWVFVVFFVALIWLSMVAMTMPRKGKVENIVKEHVRRLGYVAEEVKASWWGPYLGKVIRFDIGGESIIRFEGKDLKGYYLVVKGGRAKREEMEIRIYEGDKFARYRWRSDNMGKRAKIEYIIWKQRDGKRVKEGESWEVEPDSGKRIKLLFKGLLE